MFFRIVSRVFLLTLVLSMLALPLPPTQVSAQGGCQFPLELVSERYPDYSVTLTIDQAVICQSAGWNGFNADRWVTVTKAAGPIKLALTATPKFVSSNPDLNLITRIVSFTTLGGHDIPEGGTGNRYYQGGPLTFETSPGDESTPALAQTTIDASKIFQPSPATGNWVEFIIGFTVQVADLYEDQNGQQIPIVDNFPFSFELEVSREFGIHIAYHNGQVEVGLSQDDAGTGIFYEALPGQPLALSAYQLTPNPAHLTTDEDGTATARLFKDLSSLGSGPISDLVAVDAGDYGRFNIPVTLNFAQVIDVRGEVSVREGVSWRPVVVGEGFPKGTEFRMGAIPQDRPDLKPKVVFLFGDGKEGVIETYNNLAEGLTFRIGESYIEGQTGTVLMNGTVPLYDPNYRSWKVARTAIRLSAGAVGYLTPLGWELRAGISVGLTILDWWSSGGQRLEATGGSGGQSTTFSEITTDLMGDGSLVVTSRGAAAVLSDGGQTVMLSNDTQMTIEPDGTFSAVGALPRETLAGPAPLSLSPANGAVLTTTTPLITITYPSASYNPLIPNSLVARLNDTLVSPFMTIDTAGASWQVPPELALQPGTNRLTVALTPQNGERSRAVADFSAPDDPPSRPLDLSVYPGRSTIMLRWPANREPDLAGYQVFRAEAGSPTPILLTPQPIIQPIFIDSTPLITSAWYSVAAVDLAGQTGPQSEQRTAALDPAALLLTPATPLSFTATAGDNAVDLFFDDTLYPALAWRLERASAAGGPFNLLATLAGSPYRDQTAGNGQPYWYRLTPLGLDLTAGPAGVSGPITPLDLSPASPTGVTVEVDREVATLVWNPSPEADLAGYRVYRAAPGEPFVQHTTTLLGSPVFSETIARDETFAYRISAVDLAGQESPLSVPVEGAARRSDMTHWVSVLPTSGGYVEVEGETRYGSRLHFQAYPNPGYDFIRWSGDLSGYENPQSHILTEDMVVAAEFALQAMPGTLPSPVLAGSGAGSYQDGNGVEASFFLPQGVAVASAGTVYVADSANNRIRRVSPSGEVTTLAGSGNRGFQDGLGTAASFANPIAVAVDGTGFVYVADTDNHAIRKISPAGEVTTLAGSGSLGANDGLGGAASFFYPMGVAVDGAGMVYVADTFNRSIRLITPAGLVSTLHQGYSVLFFAMPRGIAVDAAGETIYLADTENHRILRVTPAGEVTVLAGSGSPGNTDGMGAAAAFDFPRGLALDSAGGLVVADQNNHRIRRIAPDGAVTTLAGSQPGDREGGTAMFYLPMDVAVDRADRVIVADGGNNRLRYIETNAQVTLYPDSGASLTFRTSTITTTLNFPAGAVTSPTLVTLTPFDEAATQRSYYYPHTLFRFQVATEDLAQFTKPYEIDIRYDTWETGHLDEDSLALDGPGQLASAAVDPAANRLRTETDRPGIFTLKGLKVGYRVALPVIVK